MKIFGNFLMLLVSVSLFGCVGFPSEPEDGDVFQKVIEVEGFSADELFDKVEVWLYKEFGSKTAQADSSSVDYKNKEKHTISATYNDSVKMYEWSIPAGLQAYQIDTAKYSITIDTKDEKIRISAQLIRVRERHGGGWLVAGQQNQKKAKSEEFFERLTKSLETELKSDNKDSAW